MTSLKNQIVFITGATSGIGEACAKLFAQQGAKLILVARSEDKLSALANTLKQNHETETHLISLNVQDKNAVKNAFKSLPTAWQDIDVLINSAGLALGMGKFYEHELDDIDIMFDTNVKGLIYLTYCVLPNMLKRNKGHIINLGSIAGEEVYANGNIYCTTKFAVKAFTQGLKYDLLGTDIRTTLIAPGMVETPFSLTRFKGDAERAKAVYADVRPLTPEDIANMILFAAIQPPNVVIDQITVRTIDQATPAVVNRRKKS